jgi:hypothetical protein
MIWPDQLKQRTGASRKIHAVLVHCAPRPLLDARMDWIACRDTRGMIRLEPRLIDGVHNEGFIGHTTSKSSLRDCHVERAVFE